MAKTKINLMWPNTKVEVLSSGRNKITISGRRVGRDDAPGGHVEIVINDCGYGFHNLMKQIAEAENERLGNAKQHHEWKRKKIADAWTLMGGDD